MYVPNPIAIAAVKAVAYFAIGVAVRTRAQTPGRPIAQPLGFALARVAAGWIVGLPVLLVAEVFLSELSPSAIASALALPRLGISALIIHRFFQPKGGLKETMLWAALSVLFASALDLWLLGNYETMGWARMPWC